MKTTLKRCDGPCNSLNLIWANKGGKRYCQSCWNKIKPPKPLNRTPLTKSQTPIPKRSDKRKKQEIAYSVLRKVFLEQHPVCMINLPGICSGTKTCEVHHTYSGKDREKYFLDTKTWLAVERSCHDWCHLNPIPARELGYLK